MDSNFEKFNYILTLNFNSLSSCSAAPSTVEIIESLKARIRDQEELLKRGDKYKCLICMVSKLGDFYNSFL